MEIQVSAELPLQIQGNPFLPSRLRQIKPQSDSPSETVRNGYQRLQDGSQTSTTIHSGDSYRVPRDDLYGIGSWTTTVSSSWPDVEMSALCPLHANIWQAIVREQQIKADAHPLQHFLDEKSFPYRCSEDGVLSSFMSCQNCSEVRHKIVF